MKKNVAFRALARKEALGEVLPEEFTGEQSFFVPGRLPGLNDLMKNRFETARLKKKYVPRVVARAQAQGWVPPGPAHWGYLFIEPDRKRDPANVCGGGVKLIEDALQKHALLRNDGWKYVLGYSLHWVVDSAAPGVLIISSSLGPVTLARMLEIQNESSIEEGWDPMEEERPYPAAV